MRRRQKGFTLIELVVTMTIVVLIMVALLVMSRSGEAQAALARSAQKLALDISRQQTNAMTAREFQGASPCGYGVYFQAGSDSYTLFADLDSLSDPYCGNQDFRFSSGETMLVGNFDTGVVISGITHQNIVFNPPEPSVYFSDGNPLAQRAEITLRSVRTNRTLRVMVTLAGRIYIE